MQIESYNSLTLNPDTSYCFVLKIKHKFFAVVCNERHDLITFCFTCETLYFRHLPH